MNKFYELANRKTIPVYTKMEPKPAGSQIVKYKKEKLYDYYECDYCGQEIKILEKRQEMTGGIVTIPLSITKKRELKLVLCNKCLKPLLKEFEEV